MIDTREVTDVRLKSYSLHFHYEPLGLVFIPADSLLIEHPLCQLPILFNLTILRRLPTPSHAPNITKKACNYKQIRAFRSTMQFSKTFAGLLLSLRRRTMIHLMM